MLKLGSNVTLASRPMTLGQIKRSCQFYKFWTKCKYQCGKLWRHWWFQKFNSLFIKLAEKSLRFENEGKKIQVETISHCPLKLLLNFCYGWNFQMVRIVFSLLLFCTFKMRKKQHHTKFFNWIPVCRFIPAAGSINYSVYENYF